MRTAGALMYLSFVAAVFASCVARSTPLWVVLAFLVVALFMAALVRVHAVLNAPRRER